ncbi:MAG: hypothetical protein RR543_04375 [Erysipelotrichales bacterium]
MKLESFFKEELTIVEYYGAKKPKYHKEDQQYFFDTDSIVALSALDESDSLKGFFNVISEKLIDMFTNLTIKDYGNDDMYLGYIYLDETTSLNHQEKLNEQIASISLIEAESVTFNYVIVKAINESGEELLIWLKLKSPLKIENNTFLNNPDNYEIKFTKDGIKVDNYPNFYIDTNLIAFVLYENDFYVLDKDLYQKYFNLESYYLKQASQMVYANDNIISDGELLTKGNAKMICEHFEKVEEMLEQLERHEMSSEIVIKVIDQLKLGIQYRSEEDKFILRKPQDLVDLVLLSSGCLGINSITNEPFKVKKPDYLVQD